MNPNGHQARRRRTICAVPKAQHHITYKRVPNFLRDLRDASGQTQRDFAAKLGRTQSWVFKSESGLRRVDIAEFLDWCGGCGVSPTDALAKLAKLK